MFSYFAYAAAFVSVDGEPSVDPALVGIALVLAPFVFVVVGFVSQNAIAPRQILISMGMMLALGFALGLVAPTLGAAAGFGVGSALSLNRLDLPGLMRNRLVGVALAVVYTLILLILARPAGVLTGALLPMLIVGFADEFTVWRKG